VLFLQVLSLAGCDILKGEVPPLGFSAQRRGVNLPHPTVNYSVNLLKIFTGYTQVRCELPSGC
jgi:hypothetical protein